MTKEQVTKRLIKAYERPGYHSLEEKHEKEKEIKHILELLNEIVPKEDRFEYTQQLPQHVQLKTCDVCGKFMCEGFVILTKGYETYCTEKCMLEAGISMEEYELINERKEGDSYYYEWY